MGWDQLVSWGLLGQWEAKQDTQKSHGLGQLLWDLSPCSSTLDRRAHVLQGNLQVLWLSCSCFLQKIPDLHKSLRKMFWGNC